MEYNKTKHEIISDIFIEDAIVNGFLEEEFEKIGLSYVKKQTNSKKYIRMFRHSYYLGMFSGLKYIEDSYEEKILPKFNLNIYDIPIFDKFKVFRHERIFNMIKKDALNDRFSESELNINLFTLRSKTTSEKIQRLITLSFYLGMIKTVVCVDETYAKLRPFESLKQNKKDPYDEPSYLFMVENKDNPYDELPSRYLEQNNNSPYDEPPSILSTQNKKDPYDE